jgi:hypothetical protein
MAFILASYSGIVIVTGPPLRSLVSWILKRAPSLIRGLSSAIEASRSCKLCSRSCAARSTHSSRGVSAKLLQVVMDRADRKTGLTGEVRDGRAFASAAPNRGGALKFAFDLSGDRIDMTG